VLYTDTSTLPPWTHNALIERLLAFTRMLMTVLYADTITPPPCSYAGCNLTMWFACRSNLYNTPQWYDNLVHRSPTSFFPTIPLLPIPSLYDLNSFLFTHVSWHTQWLPIVLNLAVHTGVTSLLAFKSPSFRRPVVIISTSECN
jgi:hypothetical protein